MSNKTGLYIHIPFCVKKCNYCSFLSFNAFESPRKEYADALVNEIKCRAAALSSGGKIKLDTIYVGGGTPSVLDVSQMRDIMHAVKTSFEIDPDAEITIEVNSGTLGVKDGVTKAKLIAYKYMGFNRISMGVQSMDNSRLAYLGRIHTAENVARDVRLIREAGFNNLNLDIIFSVPGESGDEALEDARKIIDLDPEHISCYSLQIEEGTPFGEAVERGELHEVPDEVDRDTYHRLIELLKRNGYEHYEISNFAKSVDSETGSGFADEVCKSPYRSRHNSRYWDMSSYIGAGLGASGFIDGIRYRNTTEIEKYINAYSKAQTDDLTKLAFPTEEAHQNTEFDNISEAVFTGLRRAEGIRYDEVISAMCADGSASQVNSARAEFWKIYGDAKQEVETFAEKGLLIIDDNGLRLTEAGIDISNSIMSLFV